MADREQVRRDAEEWKIRADDAGKMSRSYLALLAELEQAERERDLKHAQVNAYALRVTELEARLASVPALVGALRGMIELNGYRERQLLVNAAWAFTIVSDAQTALTVYDQSQGNG